MQMHLVLDLPQMTTKPEALDEARRAGFPSVEAVVDHLMNTLRVLPLKDGLYFHAEKLQDEQGNVVRRNYEGMVGARWTDGLGKTVLGITNGDEITLTVIGMDE